MDGANERQAVVFVQARHLQRLGGDLQAFGNAFKRLRVAPQRSGKDGVKCLALCAPVFAQPHRLLTPPRAELVVIVGTKRGLAVAHKVEGSHGGNLGE